MKRCPQCDISYPDSRESCGQCGFSWSFRAQFVLKLDHSSEGSNGDPDSPDTSDSPDSPDFPDFPKFPEFPEFPDFPDFPDPPEFPDPSDFPEPPELPKPPDFPEPADSSETPDIPVPPVAPGISASPESPGTSGTHVGLLRLMDIFGVVGFRFNILTVIAFFLVGCCIALIQFIFLRIGSPAVIAARDFLPYSIALKACWVSVLVGSLVLVKTTNIFKLCFWIAFLTSAGDLIIASLMANFSWLLVFYVSTGHYAFTLTLLILLASVRRVWVALGLTFFVTAIINQIVFALYISVSYPNLPLFRIKTFIVGMVLAVVFAFAFRLAFKLFSVPLKPLESYNGSRASS
ncbi:MAG: hypothetical protein GY757_31405 [bacterium]|nr:hypothetical protein [bacterium]